MDIIHLLPDSVANQIAAGEVIQRPASVIKELVENAVDAGATDIKVIIRDAGRTLIQVIDNGKGMSETDARMAFERHATSKIASADDLASLHTMGFRGEALPSICAISQLELRTCQPNSSLGTRLEIHASQVMAQEPCVCDKGSNFMVKNIFYNVPARRKFLKSDSVELANIMREFERLALVNNQIAMSIDTGSKTLALPAASFKQRIADIWKSNLNMHLLPVEVDTSLVKISGFVCKPEFARRRNPLQYLIVNGRNMRHPYFHRAILSCYEHLIASDTQPCYFIKFEVDPASIDVNVHPTKNEIKFEYEQEIWRLLSAAVKSALGKFSAVPSIDFESPQIEVDPVRPGDHVGNTFGTGTSSPSFAKPVGNPFSSGGGGGGYTPSKAPRQWERLYADFLSEAVKNTDKKDVQPAVLEEVAPAPHCMQFAEKYIVTESAEGLILIDQHRAHVRVLYEQYLEHSRQEKPLVQQVMFPETISLDESQQLALEGVEDELSRMGFRLEYLEENKWQISGVPGILKGGNAKDVVLRIIDSEVDDSVNYGKETDVEESIMQRIALMMARGTAIRRGQHLSVSEMENLVSRLFALPDPRFTPSGNPVMHVLSEQNIQSFFI